MQAGAFWIIYGMAYCYAMKCLILRTDVTFASSFHVLNLCNNLLMRVVTAHLKGVSLHVRTIGILRVTCISAWINRKS